MIRDNKVKISLSVILMMLFHASPILCAPAGNVGDPALWKGGLFTKWNARHYFLALEYDNQRNSFPYQVRRQKWSAPTTTEEYRHYEQIRGSENEITCQGIKLGTTISDSWLVYVLSGSCDTTVKLKYADETIHFGFVTGTDFTSASDIYYGLGTSFTLHEGQFQEHIPLKLGMDIKYRRFDIEDDSLLSNGTFYSATLDEIQIALILSAEAGTFNPYVGAKVSSITGKEHYINKKTASSFYPEGYINYKDDITWFKNLGFIVGGSFNIKETVSLNIESRFGDEEGFGCSATVRF